MLIHPTAARSVSTRLDRQGHQQGVLRSVRGGIATLVDDLRALDARIVGMARGLPKSAADFDALTELANGLRCVQADLLADAIETLGALAALDDNELRRRFQERQGWQLTEVEVETE